jgi:two-component system, OmpR family, sensor histidine kinase KdpD
MTEEDRRPDPDALLAHAKAEGRGKLKVYLGAAPGVGKTYEMLSDARRKKAEGVDIVVAVAETHGRQETLALLDGLEIIAKKPLAYRDQMLPEMDLDAALARQPAILLVDELAHTNVEGSRHPKRWQDIEELLAAGLEVWTTLNIQHLESLNDVVAKITRVIVRETVPDAILERADEIVLVDLTPDELIQRLKEGKVYAPEQAERALRNYFAPANLAALRELAMRRAADRIDDQVRNLRKASAAEAPWATGQRILVCVDERIEAEEIVRHAKRLADRTKAPWIAVHVETARDSRLTAADRGRIAQTLRLAARLGAETETLPGARVAETLLTYAREQNATHLLLGKAKRPALFEAVFGSVVRDLIAHAQNIVIYVVPEEEARRTRPLGQLVSLPALTPLSVTEAAILTALATLVAIPLDRFLAVSNLTLVYLAAVLISALTRGLWAGLLTGVLCALAFNWFFTEPRFTFTVADPENILTLIAFSGAALIVSTLAARARTQTLAAREQARTARELYGLARGLVSGNTEDEVAQTLASYAARAFDADCAVFARVGVKGLRLAGTAPGMAQLSEADNAAAQWAMDKGLPAGKGADTLPGARWLFVPLRTARLFSGVIAIGRDAALSPIERRRLDAFADQAANALERAHLARAYEETQIEASEERMRSIMMSSLSHDLRTPITGILGAASSLRVYGGKHDDTTKAELLSSIEGEALRLQRYVDKLLDMTRLDAGGIRAKKEAVDIGDVIARVVQRANAVAEDDAWIDGDVEAALPLVNADSTLLEQAVFNLVENAVIHAKESEQIVVRAHYSDGVKIEVIDGGPGIPKGGELRIFDKFARGEAPKGSGAGLGLAIVKGFAILMGATVSAHNRSDQHGAVFTISFPKSALASEPLHDDQPQSADH